MSETDEFTEAMRAKYPRRSLTLAYSDAVNFARKLEKQRDELLSKLETLADIKKALAEIKKAKGEA